jgi:hypothetical protein
VRPQITAIGGELVVVGSGTPAQAKVFAEEERLENPVVTDPTLEAYRRAGMKRGVLSTFSLKGLSHAMRARKGGHSQTSVKGDPWQQGGVVVVSALANGGRVTLQHAASEAGDPTDFGVVVRAIEAARG